MAYLIDGNNLIGHLSSKEGLKDPASRSALIAKLLAFQRIARKRILLVFDGPPLDGEHRLEINRRFTVFSPEPGESADFIIKDRIQNQTDKRGLIVVSSDREIRDFARACGLKDMSSSDFGRELKKALKENKNRREMAKENRFPTPLEVRLWNEVFRAKK